MGQAGEGADGEPARQAGLWRGISLGAEELPAPAALPLCPRPVPRAGCCPACPAGQETPGPLHPWQGGLHPPLHLLLLPPLVLRLLHQQDAECWPCSKGAESIRR